MSRFPVAVAIALALSLFFTSAALAGPKRDTGLSGTIELVAGSSELAVAASNPTTPNYGETVWFATTVNGNTKANSLLYVSVVCTQDGTVVYQSSGTPDFGFPLADQGLGWDGSNADCAAALIYRVQKGKNVNISILDQADFAVSATATS